MLLLFNEFKVQYKMDVTYNPRVYNYMCNRNNK